MGIKAKLKGNRCIRGTVTFLRKIFRNNRIKKSKGNRIKIKGYMKGARIFIKGKGNSCFIDDPLTNVGLRVFVQGDDNRIIIEEGCVLKNLSVWIEDNNNEVHIGKNTLICGETKLSCIEGTKITIGERCMFSDGIEVRTGDAHSILGERGKRINPSQDVYINDHVWVGHGATILKGVRIAQNCIIGAQSVVTKKFEGGGGALLREILRKSSKKIFLGT